MTTTMTAECAGGQNVGLAKMRIPFPSNQISKLPKPTKAQTDEVRQNFKIGIRCDICGAWHHPKVVHLDYVGHAALTDRLLDCDPAWTWEPMAFDADGLPVLDKDGGMWIKLTVCGVTRLGYGDAQGKIGGDAMKERIGDALRNAAMRFGAALDLWHKGDLHILPEPEQPEMNKEMLPLLDLEELLTRYGNDVMNSETGEVKKFSAKTKIQRGDGTAQKMIEFLSREYLISDAAITEIKSWEKKQVENKS